MDATLKEMNLKRSLTKFFVDNLPGTQIIFDRLLTPELQKSNINQWMCVMLEAGTVGGISTKMMTMFMFSRKDLEGTSMSTFRDNLIDLLYPGTFDFYDTSVTPWEKVAGVDIRIIDESDASDVPGNVKMKWIQTELKWAANW